VTFVDVAASERPEFLEWFARYWAELERFMDHSDPFVPEAYAKLMESAGDTTRFVWAEVDGRRAGFCVYSIKPHWYRTDIHEGYIDELYVVPEMRRNHVGRAIAAAAIQACRSRGATEVTLNVLPKNARAQAFWADLGFQPDMLRMRLALPPIG
jgi:ribosomal protein S18 acetylase RimI-like enzyme